MATLDVRGAEVQPLRGLKVNYSSVLPATPDMLSKLADSLILARKILSVAETSFSDIRRALDYPVGHRPTSGATDPAGNLTSTTESILNTHFKFFKTKAFAAFSHTDHGALYQHVAIIRRTLSLTSAGLIADVTISDARAEKLKKLVAMKRGKLKTLITARTNMAPEQFDRLDNAGVLDLLATLAQTSPEAQDRLRRIANHDKINRTARGYVSVSTAHRDDMKLAGTWADFMGDVLAGAMADEPELKVQVHSSNKGSIHYNFKYLTNAKDHPSYSLLSIARTLIHEATHKFANTGDHAYVFNNAYPNLSVAQSLTNADSYAWCCISLYKGRLFSTIDDLKQAKTTGTNLNV